MTEDNMVGWHYQINGHGFGWTLGVGDGQGGLVCCGSWVAKSQTEYIVSPSIVLSASLIIKRN